MGEKRIMKRERLKVWEKEIVVYWVKFYVFYLIFLKKMSLILK